MDLDKVLELFRALEREGVKYILVGGVAMNLHGIARATEDVDLFIQPDHENVESLKRALRSVWTDPAIDEIQAKELETSYATIRYGPPDEGVVVDILARLGEAFQFKDLVSEIVEWEKVPVSLATPQTLYRMKKATVRSRDKADAALLRERFGFKED